MDAHVYGALVLVATLWVIALLVAVILVLRMRLQTRDRQVEGLSKVRNALIEEMFREEERNEKILEYVTSPVDERDPVLREELQWLVSEVIEEQRRARELAEPLLRHRDIGAIEAALHRPMHAAMERQARAAWTQGFVWFSLGVVASVVVTALSS